MSTAKPPSPGRSRGYALRGHQVQSQKQNSCDEEQDAECDSDGFHRPYLMLLLILVRSAPAEHRHRDLILIARNVFAEDDPNNRDENGDQPEFASSAGARGQPEPIGHGHEGADGSCNACGQLNLAPFAECLTVLCRDLRTAKAGIWSGYVYATPEPLGLPYSDVQIPVENGMAPAWKFTPTRRSGDSSTLAIHIHGMGGSKAGALRGVPVADRLGYTSGGDMTFRTVPGGVGAYAIGPSALMLTPIMDPSST